MHDFTPIPVRSHQVTHATLVQGEAHAEPDDPALDLFTDLRIAPSVVVPAAESLSDTRRLMQYAGVRMAFVVDGTGAVIGLVTAADLQGERPLLATRERFIAHHDLTVSDVMTRVSDWATFDIERIKRARIGDIVATMMATGQRYLIVTETTPEGGSGPRLQVRGLFSANRVERALGAPIARELRSRSFADLAMALSHD